MPSERPVLHLAPSAPLRRSAIEAMFVLLYERDEATRGQVSSMAVTAPDGTTRRGPVAARAILIEALSAAPEAFAQWLRAPQQEKLSLSLSLAADDAIRAALPADLRAQLQMIDKDYARDRSLAESGAHTAVRLDEVAVVDLREQPSVNA